MSANPSREELAALGRTLVTFICRLGEDLVEATDRCERCNGTAACDACFAALQATGVKVVAREQHGQTRFDPDDENDWRLKV